jgi:hypothetical protein
VLSRVRANKSKKKKSRGKRNILLTYKLYMISAICCDSIVLNGITCLKRPVIHSDSDKLNYTKHEKYAMIGEPAYAG